MAIHIVRPSLSDVIQSPESMSFTPAMFDANELTRRQLGLDRYPYPEFGEMAANALARVALFVVRLWARMTSKK